MACQWNSRIRDYDYEKRLGLLLGEEIFNDHPLQSVTMQVQESKIKRWGSSAVSSNTSSGPGTPRKMSATAGSISNPLDPSLVMHPLSRALEGLDPLSQFAASDPLTQMANQTLEPVSISIQRAPSSSIDPDFESWTSKRSAILMRYTTSEKLSITTSFLSGTEKVLVKSSSSVSDKVKTRLEQLDDFEEGSVKEMLNLSQQEYVCRIEELNQALRESWDQDQRVKALKIAIQCAKLLVDTSVIQFYPSKFVLVTDILDNFGRLVNQRIHSKAEYFRPGSNKPIPLPENFTPDQVPESAKETCRNWFFKIASIRELIPRFFVETAILRCYSFLDKGEYSRALMRLTKTVCGIGDPLVAAYARCYLCRVGMAVAPNVRDHVSHNFWDFLSCYSQLGSSSVLRILNQQNVTLASYLTLYSPALDWILQCLTYKASNTLLSQVLDGCKTQDNRALLLNSIMAAFPPEFVAQHSVKFVDLIKASEETGFPKHLLLRTLGSCLALSDPPENHRLQVLNDVWKVVTKLKTPADYMSCAEVWISYPVKHFTKLEVNTFLGDILKHLLPDRAFENHYTQLALVVQKLVTSLPDVAVLFSMDKFLPFLDMLQKESVKVEACKTVVEAFVSSPQEPTSDPVVINALMFICKIMHDSVNALTLEDDKRQISSLVAAFIRRISFKRDFEQQLNFYVEARANFSNLDLVIAQLVQSINLLSMQTRQVVQGHHTRKTAAFVKACAAYAFITIPSLMGVFQRLDLYLVCGQVALLNQCLSQADAFFKAAISLLPEVPSTIDMDGKQKSSETFFISYIYNLLSTLLVVPDHPDQEPLYLVRGLLNMVGEYTWDNLSDSKAQVYLGVLNLMSATAQETYIYHIEKVDSNDALYGGDPKFIAEIDQICSTLVEEILAHLKILGEKNFLKRQSHLAFELFLRICLHGDLNNNGLFDLAHNLWMLAHKNGNIDNRYAVRCLEMLKKKGARKGGKKYQDLGSKLQIPSTV